MPGLLRAAIAQLYRPKAPTVGIMGAMPQEIESIHGHMSETKIVNHGGREYHIGRIKGHNVVLVFSRWGKVAAAATATSLITEFEVTRLILTGVAGAVAPNLNIGDVVISKRLYQHDMDARPLMPKHEVPLTGLTFFTANAELAQKAQAATNGLFSSLNKKVAPSVLAKFNISDPKCVLGTIATGDQFIYDPKKTEGILAERPETTAVEMEGAAVAQVCNDYKVPFVVIRTISDKADHSSKLDFPAFVGSVASHYSEHIVNGMLEPPLL